jgi:hypothetical protein
MTDDRAAGQATRFRLRSIAYVAVGLLAMSALSACSPQGNDANNWMRGNRIVQSSSTHLDGCGGTCEPIVKAQIKASATDTQVRQLARASASYLAKQNGLRIYLKYHGVSVSIDRSVSVTSALTDSLILLIHDPKVTGGNLFSSYLDIWTAKNQVVAVFTAHSAESARPISVESTPGTGTFSVQNERLDSAAGGAVKCAINDALLTVAADLISDPTVTSLNASMCGETEVEASSFPSVNRIAAKLQLRTSERALTGNKFSVRHDGNVSTSVHVVTAATATFTPYLEFLDALPGVIDYGTDVGSISVGPVDSKKFTDVMTAIDMKPRPAGVRTVTVNSASGSLYANGDGTLSVQLSLNHAVMKLGAGSTAIAANVSPTELNFIVPGYTSEKAHQLVDAVLASGLWKSRPTKIQFLGNSTAFTVKWDAGSDTFTATGADGNTATQNIVADLGSYWTTQSR